MDGRVACLCRKTNLAGRFVRHVSAYSNTLGREGLEGWKGEGREKGGGLALRSASISVTIQVGRRRARPVQWPTRRHSTGMTMHTPLHLLLNVILKPCLVPLVHAYMHPSLSPILLANVRENASLSRLAVEPARARGCFPFLGQWRCLRPFNWDWPVAPTTDVKALAMAGFKPGLRCCFLAIFECSIFYMHFYANIVYRWFKTSSISFSGDLEIAQTLARFRLYNAESVCAA